ncbi:IspD/TarI family cytidylyltransferase [Butyrivibrio sp. XPD2006]|uniref:IspD/TarI family cytidylyltransferase n=1 Tax=Butyrivibrio sp. XPD2006 TaxID=1280668 RepID=UPI0003B4331C|nr:IspD/TarI family cytidylyltransferase [Butyrivibrio sp. XPD2006]
MNIAIIIAGGVGNRMGQDIPKQFINVYDKPVIVYTLEAFQRHPQVDAIEVVCIEGWEAMVWAYARQFNISKLRWVTEGGRSGQESIRNGVFFLEDKCDENDIIIIHDGIRPVVNSEVLTDVIDKCNQYGNAVTSSPCNDQMFLVDESDEKSTTDYIVRERIRKVTTPQAYRFSLVDKAYHDAFNSGKGLHSSSYTNTMMVDLGIRLYFAEGSEKNIKLTTVEDLEIFKAILKSEKQNWIKSKDEL